MVAEIHRSVYRNLGQSRKPNDGLAFHPAAVLNPGMELGADSSVPSQSLRPGDAHSLVCKMLHVTVPIPFLSPGRLCAWAIVLWLAALPHALADLVFTPIDFRARSALSSKASTGKTLSGFIERPA